MSKLTGFALISLTVFVLGGVRLSGWSPTYVPQENKSQGGAIAGRVLDAQGRPIVGSIVLAERTENMTRPTPRAWTNSNGEFKIENLSAGLYVLRTENQKEGYPPSEFDFYLEADRDLEVQVSDSKTTPNITIQRGLKASLLEGIVVDGTTNQPVKAAQLTVRRVDRPERFLSTGLFWHPGDDPLKSVAGGFKFLVPASLPFTLTVSAPGYDDWYYKGTLLLSSDTTEELRVVLHRRPIKRQP